AAVLGRRLAAGAVESGHEADAAQGHRLDVTDLGDVSEGLQLVTLALGLLGDLRARQGERTGAADRADQEDGEHPRAKACGPRRPNAQSATVHDRSPKATNPPRTRPVGRTRPPAS